MKYWLFQMPEMPGQLSHAGHADHSVRLVPSGLPGQPGPLGRLDSLGQLGSLDRSSSLDQLSVLPAGNPAPPRPPLTAGHAFPPRKLRISSRALPACPKCGRKSLHLSAESGFKEEFLSVVGATFYRCQRCETRYTKLKHFWIRQRKPSEAKSHKLVFAAIAAGFLCCLAVALYVQRVAHRWPF